MAGEEGQDFTQQPAPQQPPGAPTKIMDDATKALSGSKKASNAAAQGLRKYVARLKEAAAQAQQTGYQVNGLSTILSTLDSVIPDQHVRAFRDTLVVFRDASSSLSTSVDDLTGQIVRLGKGSAQTYAQIAQLHATVGKMSPILAANNMLALQFSKTLLDRLGLGAQAGAQGLSAIIAKAPELSAALAEGKVSADAFFVAIRTGGVESVQQLKALIDYSRGLGDELHGMQKFGATLSRVWERFIARLSSYGIVINSLSVSLGLIGAVFVKLYPAIMAVGGMFKVMSGQAKEAAASVAASAAQISTASTTMAAAGGAGTAVAMGMGATRGSRVGGGLSSPEYVTVMPGGGIQKGAGANIASSLSRKTGTLKATIGKAVLQVGSMVIAAAAGFEIGRAIREAYYGKEQIDQEDKYLEQGIFGLPKWRREGPEGQGIFSKSPIRATADPEKMRRVGIQDKQRILGGAGAAYMAEAAIDPSKAFDIDTWRSLFITATSETELMTTAITQQNAIMDVGLAIQEQHHSIDIARLQYAENTGAAIEDQVSLMYKALKTEEDLLDFKQEQINRQKMMTSQLKATLAGTTDKAKQDKIVTQIGQNNVEVKKLENQLVVEGIKLAEKRALIEEQALRKRFKIIDANIAIVGSMKDILGSMREIAPIESMRLTMLESEANYTKFIGLLNEARKHDGQRRLDLQKEAAAELAQSFKNLDVMRRSWLETFTEIQIGMPKLTKTLEMRGQTWKRGAAYAGFRPMTKGAGTWQSFTGEIGLMRTALESGLSNLTDAIRAGTNATNKTTDAVNRLGPIGG
jgi:hypothetical protein